MRWTPAICMTGLDAPKPIPPFFKSSSCYKHWMQDKVVKKTINLNLVTYTIFSVSQSKISCVQVLNAAKQCRVRFKRTAGDFSNSSGSLLSSTVAIYSPFCQNRPALSDGTVKETFGLLRQQQNRNASASGAFTSDGDQICISTKWLDVLLNPTKAFDLIENACVTRHFIRIKWQKT